MTTLRVGAYRCWRCGEAFIGVAQCPQGNDGGRTCVSGPRETVTLRVIVTDDARPAEHGIAAGPDGEMSADARRAAEVAYRQVEKLSQTILQVTEGRGATFLARAEMVEAMEALAVLDRIQRGVTEAAYVARRYGGIDGEHHKRWVIDQMLRAMLGAAGYASWRDDYGTEGEGHAGYRWDEGIAP